MSHLPPIQDLAALNNLRRLLVFNVTNPEPSLTGLPCISGGANGDHVWNLPRLGPEYDQALGREMALAFLRLMLVSGKRPFNLDTVPPVLPILAEAMRFPGKLWATAEHRQGFFAGLAAFLELSLNTPDRLPDFLVRLAALGNDDFRARCLDVLAGHPQADFFTC